MENFSINELVFWLAFIFLSYCREKTIWNRKNENKNIGIRNIGTGESVKTESVNKKEVRNELQL